MLKRTQEKITIEAINIVVQIQDTAPVVSMAWKMQKIIIVNLSKDTARLTVPKGWRIHMTSKFLIKPGVFFQKT